jgi:hypothetical protein
MIHQSRIEDNTYKGTFLLVLFIILLIESCSTNSYSASKSTEMLIDKKEIKLPKGLSTQTTYSISSHLRR